VTPTGVRPAIAGDLDGVVRTFLACWHGSYRGLLPPDVRAIYTADSARRLWQQAPLSGMLVAEVPERGVLGVARYGADPQDPARGHVFSLYVHPDAQGLGLGRSLLEAAVQGLAAAGHSAATLWVFSDNTAARAFYTRLGWTPDGATRTEPAYRLPEVRLRRTLPGQPA
jgi:ribosomal protein S18 acetylase RimI-like enzyme